MPSLFGTGNGNPKGRYEELGQLESDDEFSPSDDEKVLFKKSGEIELRLCPETRIQRAKVKRRFCQHFAVCAAILVVVLCLVAVAVVFVKFHAVKPVTKHKTTKPQTSQPEPGEEEQTKTSDGWKITFKDMAGEGSVRLLDVNGDGIDDIIVASGTASSSIMDRHTGSTKFDGLHKLCEEAGQDYPCMGNLIALNGHNGSQLWSMKIRMEAFVLNCEDFDVNKDNKKDCIATGRLGQIAAFDPYLGETLWTCENDEFFQAYWNTYHAAALPDWDGDGVPEILIANGGDSEKRPDDHNRESGRLVALSGATGKPFGKRYLEMPNSKETYMSPVMYTPVTGSATYILFGSGGETISGDLMGISVKDFCHYILVDDADVCDHNSASEFSGIEKDENGIFIIYKGKEKGVMVPPVIVDYNNDGVKDILMTSFEGINNLYSGVDLNLTWTANFPGMETYGTPAPGYFDDDSYIDFMVTWNLGEWMDYNSSYVYMLSGKDGSVLWSLESAYMQSSSHLSISTSLKQQDAFLFKVVGRDSKYRWADEGLIKPNSSEVRRKRHGGNLPESTLPPVEMRKKQFYSHLNCEDDLTSFKGEVFIIDRKAVKNPVKVLEIPTKKHTYDANPKCGDEPPILTNHGVPLAQDGNELTKESQEGNMFHSHDENDNGENDEDVDDDDDDSDVDNDDDGDDSRKLGPRDRRKREDEPEKKVKMCAVEEPDIMSLGIIGEVDGDDNLDFISVTSTTTMLYDAEYCHQGMLAELIVQKVSLEKGLLDGSFKQVTVKAETTMKDSGVHIPVQKEKTFLPMSKQRWTQYLGTAESNVYR